jgi:hypothetical protein
MTKILTAVLAALTLTTVAQAKIGETRIEAEGRWGKPAFEKGPLSYYFTQNWMILQAYDDQGTAAICGYYNKELTNDDARKFDLLNFPDVKAWKQLPDSDAEMSKQWISDDGQCCIVSGTALHDGVILNCRMYLTEKGTEIAHSQGLMDEPWVDIEKQTTN